MSNRTDQKNNIAGGDIVAGNKITHVNPTPVYYEIPALSALYEKFKTEIKLDPNLETNIEKFDYFTTPFKGDIIGLEAKLKAGDFHDIVDYALEAKEQFHKLLYKYQFYESAQRIHCFLLSLVQSYFHTYIYPSISLGVEKEQVIILVQEKIVDPLLLKLGENILDLVADDIQGMVYFLTGNCHLKWSKS